MNSEVFVAPGQVRPLLLMNVKQHLIVGTSARATIEKAFGVGLGLGGEWFGYVCGDAAEPDRATYLLLHFDAAKILAAFEFAANPAAVPARLRALPPRDYGSFRFMPGSVALAEPETRVDRSFTPHTDEAVKAFADRSYAARTATSLGIISTMERRIVRFGVYREGTEPFPYARAIANARPAF